MSVRLSVIIPSYNSASFLESTIKSVLAQSFEDFEVIVVDDGSTDATRTVAEQFGNSIRYFYQENKGVSAARNTGLKMSRGEYVAFLDADDRWISEKLEKQVRALDSDREAIACFCLTDYLDENGRVVESSEAPEYADLVEALLLYSCIIGPPSSVVIRKVELEALEGFDPDFSQCADWDLWIRLAEKGKIVYVPETLVQYALHDSNMSNNTPLLEKDTFAVLDKFFALPVSNPYQSIRHRVISNHYLILSGCYFHSNELANSIRCLVKSIRLYPLNMKRVFEFSTRFLRRKLAGESR